MIDKQSSTLIIKDDEIVEFECLVSFDPEHGKHFRVLKDEMNYEEMIRELMYKGYKKSTVSNMRSIKLTETISQEIPVYEENQIEINSVEELVAFLSERGFECEIVPSSSYSLVTSVSVDGQDIGYEVISSTNKIKISAFTLNLFKTALSSANNKEYEPIINEKAGSYEIEIFDTKRDESVENAIQELMVNLKNELIDTQVYLQKKYYYNLVNSFLELSVIKYLDIVKVKFSDSEFVEFTKNEILSLKSKVKDLLTTIPFSFVIDSNALPRAIDAKNLSFKLDTEEGVRYCHTQTPELFEIISNIQNRMFTINGFYTSIKSVKITNIQRNS